MNADRLATLVAEVIDSPRHKYRYISPELIAAIGTRELAHRSSVKDAVKATKSKLHQIGAAYLDSTPDYAAWQTEIKRCAEDPAHLRTACLRMMRGHASTRDRLAFLPEFYATILASLPPLQSVLDLACGLQPLALPWMPIEAGVQYWAYDIFGDMIEFLNVFFAVMNVAGRAHICDLTVSCPQQPVDLALILKALPCLEQLDRTAGRRLIESINARFILVSYPLTSLGGKRKGMEITYEAHFQALLAGKPWPVRRFTFPNELAFLIETPRKRG